MIIRKLFHALLFLCLCSCLKNTSVEESAEVQKVDTIFQTVNVDVENAQTEIAQFNKKLERNGFRKVLDANGNLMRFSEYRNDTLEGLSVTLGENLPVELVQFKNHKVSGYSIEFGNSGDFIYQIQYSNGEPLDTIGIWRREQ